MSRANHQTSRDWNFALRRFPRIGTFVAAAAFLAVCAAFAADPVEEPEDDDVPEQVVDKPGYIDGTNVAARSAAFIGYCAQTKPRRVWRPSAQKCRPVEVTRSSWVRAMHLRRA